MSKSQISCFWLKKKQYGKPPVKLFINDDEQLWSKPAEMTNNKLHKGITILTELCKYVQENLAWYWTPKTKK